MQHGPPANHNFEHNERDLLDGEGVAAAVHGNALGGVVQFQNHEQREQGQRDGHDHAGADGRGVPGEAGVPAV